MIHGAIETHVRADSIIIALLAKSTHERGWVAMIFFRTISLDFRQSADAACRDLTQRGDFDTSEPVDA